MSRTLCILAVVASVSVANAAFVNPLSVAASVADKASASLGLNQLIGGNIFPSSLPAFNSFGDLKTFISKNIDTLFNNYLKNVGSVKGNATTGADLEERKKNFLEKLNQIIEQNFNQFATYILGVNQFSDMSESEFMSKYANAIPEDLTGESSSNSNSSASEDQNLGSAGRNKRQAPKTGSCGDCDWRKDGHVTPVRDQGQCGSCYAFGSTGTLEAMLAIKCGTKNLDLSEQDLMDCSVPQGNPGGCKGGNAKNSYTYFQNIGLALESDYPYSAKDGSCNSAAKRQSKVANWQRMNPLNDENAVACALSSTGPMAVMVDATGWSAYKGGVFGAVKSDAPVTTTTTTTAKPKSSNIFSSFFDIITKLPADFFKTITGAFNPNAVGSSAPCSSDPKKADHLVVLVGSGVDPELGPYWIIKNSWGAKWGEQGYIRIAKGSNTCGIANNPMQVTDVQCQ